MNYKQMIKRTDFLGEPFTFTLDKMSIMQSIPGGIISIFLYLSYLCFFFFFGLDFFLKQNPNTNTQIRISNDKNKQNMKISKDEFIFSVRIEDEFSKTVNSSNLLYPVLYFKNFTFDKESKKFKEYTTVIDMVNCKGLNYKDAFDKSIYNAEDFFCPNITQLENKTLGGFWKDDLVTFLKFEFRVCKDQNFTECNDIDYIIKNTENQYSELYITILYPEVIFDVENYEKPLKFDFKYFYHTLNLRLKNRDDLFLIRNQLEDNSGMLFETINEKNKIGGFKVDRHISPTLQKLNKNEPVNSYTNLVYALSIFYDNSILFHTRKYMKFQDLLANVSGFMDLFIFIISLFYRIYNKFKLDSFLFRRLVSINDVQKIPNKENFNIKLQKYNNSDKDEGSGKNKNIFSNSKTIQINNESSKNKNDHDKLNQMIELHQSDKSNKNLNISLNNKSNRIDLNDSNRILNTEHLKKKYSKYSLDIYNEDHFIDIKTNPKGSKLIQSKLKKFNEEVNLDPMSIDNVFNEKIQILKIRKNFSDFDFLHFTYYVFCEKKLFPPKFKCMEYFSEKFYEKLDLISYFKKMKTLNLIEKLLFEENERYFINLLSNKMYYIDDLNFDETTQNIKKLKKEEKLKKLINQKNFLNKSEYSRKMIKILKEKI